MIIKDQMKKKENKRKKEKCDNLGDNEKEQLRKYKNKGKLCMIASGMMRKNKLEKMIKWINAYKL